MQRSKVRMHANSIGREKGQCGYRGTVDWLKYLVPPRFHGTCRGGLEGRGGEREERDDA